MAPVTKTSKYNPVLLQTGQNMHEVSPELSDTHQAYRKKISAAQAWPIAGDWGVKDFPKFNDFPAEIRNKIWSFAVAIVEEARVVNIWVKNGKLGCNVVTPRLLYVCSAARQEALRVYRPLIFDDVFTGSYINFDIDLVFFATDLPLIKVFGARPTYPIFQQHCRYLALTIKPLEVYKTGLSRFARLEELVVVRKVIGQGLGGSLEVLEPSISDLFDRYEFRRMIEKIEPIESKVKNIKTSTIKDVGILEYPRPMTQMEKGVAREQRRREREHVAPVNQDEDLAIRMQYALDHNEWLDGDEDSLERELGHDIDE